MRLNTFGAKKPGLLDAIRIGFFTISEGKVNKRGRIFWCVLRKSYQHLTNNRVPTVQEQRPALPQGNPRLSGPKE